MEFVVLLERAAMAHPARGLAVCGVGERGLRQRALRGLHAVQPELPGHGGARVGGGADRAGQGDDAADVGRRPDHGRGRGPGHRGAGLHPHVAALLPGPSGHLAEGPGVPGRRVLGARQARVVEALPLRHRRLRGPHLDGAARVLWQLRMLRGRRLCRRHIEVHKRLVLRPMAGCRQKTKPPLGRRGHRGKRGDLERVLGQQRREEIP
mmetsp:Transcript_85654/g.262075  ORF Transcript_85654/g.262075 Transcript_85654/m.262075 type:complete len:208 (+) Transcript_85654:370-993(+)